MSNFIIPANRNAIYLSSSLVDDLVSADHLARFIVEAIDQLDISNITRQYAGVGSAAYHPATLLAIMVYGYATGVRSSRKLERATYEVIPFIFAAAATHPDHSTLADFRIRFLDEVKGLFVQILVLAKEMKLLKLGNISLDGTKIHANASRHSALSHGHIEKMEVILKAEVDELLDQATREDKDDVAAKLNLPEEIKRREDRLAVMAEAKGKIAKRAEERYQREKAEYDEKMARRAAREAESGRTPGGKVPAVPEAGPRDGDQINLTDEESRIMHMPGNYFEQAYNAQAAVDMGSMLVVACQVTQAANDKEQIEPMLAIFVEQSDVLGMPTHMVADAGYCSEKGIVACEKRGIVPLIAVAREKHHPGWRDRFAKPDSLPADATVIQKMAHSLKEGAGKAIYKLRKQTVEPVFGIIKSVMGFRQFSLRGLDKAEGEWTLVCLAWNLKRMASLRPKFGQN